MEDIVTIDVDTCNGCNICTTSCPVDVLRFNAETSKAYVAYPEHCHVCYLCEEDCPTQAIRVATEVTNSRRRSIYDVLHIKTD